MNNELFLSGRCPYCGTTLDYSEGRDAVYCHCCERAVSTSSLLLDKAVEESAILEEDRFLIENVTTVSAGMIYFDNFCESYDWSEFFESTALSVPRFNAIAEAYKLKYGTNPLTYILDFRRIVVPVVKKMEYIRRLEKEILAKPDADESALFSVYDRHATFAETLLVEKKRMFDLLTQDVNLAHRYGADEDIVAALLKNLEELRIALEGFKISSSFKTSKLYETYKAKKDTACAAELAKGGINAAATYEKARTLMEEGDIDSALHLLLAVRGYMDSEEILATYTKAFSFAGELMELGGKTFYLRDGESIFFDVEDPTDYKKCQCKNLYAVENGIPATAPTIQGVTRVIGCFGSRIYFIKDDCALCVYNTKPSDTYVSERVLMRAPAGDWAVDDGYHAVCFSEDKSRFFLRKKLRDAKQEKKRGCALFAKKPPVRVVDRRNNYSVVVVNMDRATASVVLPEVIDVQDFFGDNLFYTYTSTELSGTSFRMYNIMAETDEEILHEDCVIHSMSQGYILYSLYAPNAYNMNLYAFHMEKKKSRLIEKNVFTHYATAGNKVFYTVGNAESNRLYVYDLKTRAKAEILENAGNVTYVTENWIYYLKGDDRNAVLMRVGTDGHGASRVASRVARFIRMSSGYIYYVNASDELHLVRGDGHGDVTIAKEVSRDNVVMDDKHVYYLRHEAVGDVALEESGRAYSLYATDLEGKNLKKLAFNVTDIKEYDETYVYLRSEQMASFSVTVPVSKDISDTTVEEFKLTDYSRLNKATGEIQPLMTLGAPTPESRTFRVGCWPFRKNRVIEGAVFQNLKSRNYVRPGATVAGTVYREEMEKRLLEEEKKNSKK